MGERRDGRCRHRGGDVPVRAPPARRLDAGRPGRVRGRLGLRRLRRGCGLRARAVGRGVRRAGPPEVRHLRRRRLRRRPDLRRHPRRVRREGQQGHLPRARRDRRRHRGRPPRRPRHGHRAPGPRRPRPPHRRPSRRADRRTVPGLGADGRRRARRRDRAAGARHQRDADVRPRRRAPRRGHAGLRLGVRAEAADAGLRRHRLRRRGRAGGRVPRLLRDRVRRASGLRHQEPLPRGRRGRRRLAAPLPAGRAGRRPGRPADRDRRAHPRPEVRRPAARGRAAPARGRVRRGDGLTTYPRRPARAAARGGGHREGDRPAVQPDRARPRRPHARGDRDLDRGRDRGAAVGRFGRPAG